MQRAGRQEDLVAGAADSLAALPHKLEPAADDRLTDVGMMIDTAPIASVRPHQIDTILIPGGPGIWALRQDATLMKWVSRAMPRVRRVASVCLGAFVLGWTGVLSGKRAATHWRYCPRLQDGFPDVQVEPNAIFVQDGRVWTSAGVSAASISRWR
jgi:transcriptional regulator GlxA family with amidase domain